MKIKACLLGLSAVACWQAPALAADMVAPPRMAQPAPSDWSIAVTGYGWMAGLDGDQALFGLPPVKLNLKFMDILPDLDFAAAGVVDIQKGRWGFLGELNYVKLSSQQAGPAGFVTLKVGSSSLFGLAAASYRLTEGDWGNIDAVGGAKFFSMSSKLTLIPPSPLPVLHGEDGASWVDATAGFKVRLNLSPSWFVTGWLMGGAGGSNFHWDALATIGYQIDPRWSVSAGYRAMGVDYQSARFSYDVIQHGPIVGVTARF
jgi:opacity protein-like surface antigen